MASATLDEDMNFMTKMRKNRKDVRKRRTKGVGGLVDSIAAENHRSFIRYYIQKQSRKPKW
jgi:hypothetical protein